MSGSLTCTRARQGMLPAGGSLALGERYACSKLGPYLAWYGRSALSVRIGSATADPPTREHGLGALRIALRSATVSAPHSAI